MQLNMEELYHQRQELIRDARQLLQQTGDLRRVNVDLANGLKEANRNLVAGSEIQSEQVAQLLRDVSQSVERSLPRLESAGYRLRGFSEELERSLEYEPHLVVPL